MREVIELGNCPYNESCAQVSDPDYREKSVKECNAFIAQLMRVLHNNNKSIPSGFRIYKKSFPHDFGSYYEVVCAFDSDNEESVELAYYLDENIPAEWDQEALESLERCQLVTNSSCKTYHLHA